jgi:hypothetical protein
VEGLLSTILIRKECVDFFDLEDLVEVARQKGGIEILVDYYAFQNFIIQKIWNGLSQYRNNELRVVSVHVPFPPSTKNKSVISNDFKS